MKRYNINLGILLRSILLILTTIIGSYFIFNYSSYFIELFFIPILFIEVIELNLYFKQTNKKIAFFFDAIENNDTMLHFSHDAQSASLSQLNKSLNRVNDQIQEIKLQSKEQEQFYQQMLEKVATGVVICNAKGHIVFANAKAKYLLQQEQFTNLVQLKRTNIRLYNIIINLTPGQKKLVKTQLNQSVVHLSFELDELKTRNESIQLISFYDIHTELDEREVDAWIRLIRVLTHEIMNSIAPITSLSETILGYFTTNNQCKHPNKITKEIISDTVEGLRIVKDRGSNLTDFVTSYRKLTKIPFPQRTEFPLINLIDKVRILSSTHPGFENTEFKVSLSPENIMVCADESQLTHVLINIVKNAIEAADETPTPKITITGKQQTNNRVIIIITDNGRGISAELADQVFVPFFTTKENGSGIGLSFSRQVLRMHNGTLNIKSVHGQGTSVIITI